MKKYGKIFMNGIIDENPTFRMVLGMCPTLAITTAASNGIGMGLAVTFVLIFSNLVISLLRKAIPDQIRIPAFIVVIATFVTIVQLIIKAFLPALDASLGVFIPLIVVNCIIFGRAEAFAFKNKPLASAVDGLGMGLGFTLAITPTLVRPEVMRGTGFLNSHADEIYRLREPDDQYLVGTSEVALAGMHENEILNLENGPLRYCGWSSCYRREAGAAGKDTSGIIRVHQFDKVEMFVYAKQEDSYKEHEHLLAMEQEMLGKVEVPYRIIDTAAGDLGSSAARKFDCEAWVPTQGRYRELTSTSNCTEYQARRLNIRERMEDGNTRAVSTLNGTLATTRWLVAILENHQQKDGSIEIPKAMRPYMGGKEVIEPTKWEA